MRKITGVLLSLVLLFALAGCSNTATANGLSFGPSPSATQQEETVAEGQSNSASVDAESEVPWPITRGAGRIRSRMTPTHALPSPAAWKI